MRREVLVSAVFLYLYFVALRRGILLVVRVLDRRNVERDGVIRFARPLFGVVIFPIYEKMNTNNLYVVDERVYGDDFSGSDDDSDSDDDPPPSGFDPNRPNPTPDFFDGPVGCPPSPLLDMAYKTFPGMIIVQDLDANEATFADSKSGSIINGASFFSQGTRFKTLDNGNGYNTRIPYWHNDAYLTECGYDPNAFLTMHVRFVINHYQNVYQRNGSIDYDGEGAKDWVVQGTYDKQQPQISPSGPPLDEFAVRIFWNSRSNVDGSAYGAGTVRNFKASDLVGLRCLTLPLKTDQLVPGLNWIGITTQFIHTDPGPLHPTTYPPRKSLVYFNARGCSRQGIGLEIRAVTIPIPLSLTYCYCPWNYEPGKCEVDEESWSRVKTGVSLRMKQGTFEENPFLLDNNDGGGSRCTGIWVKRTSNDPVLNQWSITAAMRLYNYPLNIGKRGAGLQPKVPSEK